MPYATKGATGIKKIAMYGKPHGNTQITLFYKESIIWQNLYRRRYYDS
jgi:hypothetical protein